jgi:capsid protein
MTTDWSQVWHYDGRQHVDPDKEGKGQKLRLENGTTTMATELGNMGFDWKETMQQQKAENDFAETMGLPKPHTVGEVTGQVIATPEDIEDQNEDEQAETEAANQSV